MIDALKPTGQIKMGIQIEYENGEEEIIEIDFKNSVLLGGRNALAASLANQIGSSYDFFISRMIFGNGGTQGGVPKYVDSGRNGLFGLTQSVKPVIATIDPNVINRVTFTSIMGADEANGVTLNEMALQMNNGDLYSMATFADLNKTSLMKITFGWELDFI
jgi:hypothetical protein